MTSEKYTKKNLEFQSQLMNTAKIVRELMKEDRDTKLCWLPCVLTTKKGMILSGYNQDLCDSYKFAHYSMFS